MSSRRANSNHWPDVSDNGEIISRRRRRATQVIVDSFWKRRVHECASILIQRKKLLLEQASLQVRDVVLIVDHDELRLRQKWAENDPPSPSNEFVVFGADRRNRTSMEIMIGCPFRIELLMFFSNLEMTFAVVLLFSSPRPFLFRIRIFYSHGFSFNFMDHENN